MDGRRRALAQRDHDDIPLDIRLGRGTVVEYDARVGLVAPGGNAQDLEIGADSRLRGGAVVYRGSRVGSRFDLGFNAVLHEGCVVGDDVHVGDNCVIGVGCTIGDGVRIDANCSLSELTTIDDGAHLAPGVTTAADPHPGGPSHLCARGPHICRGAEIGPNVTLLPFVTVGEYSFVAAGSVVTSDVPAHVVAAGNPTRVVRSVSEVRCPLDIPSGTYLRGPLVRARATT